jgi:two-component system, response regulator PdtaR
MSQPAMLIVEDEPLIRMCAVDFAEEAGYAGLEASTAAEALAILERGEDIEILFTDITLPGEMDGIDLAGKVAERWPDVRIMLASGALAGLPADVAPNAYRLPKPYGITQFLHALEQMESPAGHER